MRSENHCSNQGQKNNRSHTTSTSNEEILERALSSLQLIHTRGTIKASQYRPHLMSHPLKHTEIDMMHKGGEID